MAYLPPLDTLDTEVSPADARDIRTAMGLIEEKWRRHYPVVRWHQLDYTPGMPSEAGEANVIGAIGATRVDDLWGEAVPCDEVTGEFFQPHGKTEEQTPADVGTRYKFKDPVEVHCLLQYDPIADPLKLSSTQGMRKARLVVPTVVADRAGLTISVGDEVRALGMRFTIEQAHIPERARWKWTNIPLYIVCMASMTRQNS